MRERFSNWYSRAMVIGFVWLLCSYVEGFAAGPAPRQPSRPSQSIEATIIHVDKYAVYIPNVVLYWDPAMEPKRIAALTRVADQLRNKKAAIAFVTVNEKTGRAVIADISPVQERVQEYAERETPSDEEPRESIARERVHAPPALPSERTEANDDEEFPTVAPPPDFAPELPSTGRDRPSSGFAKQEIVGFVKNILRLSNARNLSGILSQYADEVNYYTRGTVSRSYIRKDLEYYFRNWDEIDSSLDGDVVVIVTDQLDLRIVKFISTFSVANEKKAITGRSENIWTIQKINNALKITDQKQRILSSQVSSGFE